MKFLELPPSIKTVEQAQFFLDLLHEHKLLYHPEDDATDCLEGLVSYEQAKQINVLMGQIYDLNENTRLPETFDPCQYCIDNF